MALNEALAPWFLSRSKLQAMDELLAGGVRAAAVLTPFDVSRPGNSNAGHTYGTTLSPAEKRALVEYLKTR